MGLLLKSSQVEGYTVEFDPTDAWPTVEQSKIIAKAGSVPSWITTNREPLATQIGRVHGSTLTLNSGDFKVDPQLSNVDFSDWHPYVKLALEDEQAFLYPDGVLTFYSDGEFLGYAILPTSI